MTEDREVTTTRGPTYVKVADLRPEGETSGCLRPLGLCELGGCCDICCYGNDRVSSQPSSKEPETDEG